ncbi:MAG: hypothetical protein J7513_03790 [Solirubrobacteraceae bacterium]|nr:hypothetical protein [Solirubrobacteraceae bacterium]
MRRLLPTLAAFALVIVGVGGGLLLLTSRDHGSLEPSTPAPAAAAGPAGLPAGNVVVEFTSGADRRTIDDLAAELGAVDSPATRSAGQALVSKKVTTELEGVRALAGASTVLSLPAATDPQLAAFVREHLGRTDEP